MNVIALTPLDLILAGGLVILLAMLSILMQLGVAQRLLIAAVRTAVQLMLIGMVLNTLFANVHLVWVSMLAMVMLLVAGREVMARQHRRFSGWWGYGTLCPCWRF